MSRSIEVSDSTYSALEAAAAAEGTTPGEWLIANVPSPLSVDPEGEVSPEILAQRFRGLIKRAQYLGGNLSGRHSELFTEGLEEKRWMGNL